jgi:hypothetical protein
MVLERKLADQRVRIYLRRHKLRRTTEGARTRSIPHLLFTQSVISNFDVSV